VRAGLIVERPAPIFFIHVMKTGGITLFESIRRNFAPDEVYPQRGVDVAADIHQRVTFRHLRLDHLAALSEDRRRRIRLYTGHFPYVACEVLGGPLQTVTVLRDPVHRTISLLRQFQRAASAADPRLEGHLARPLSLEEVYEQPNVFAPMIRDHQTKLFSMTLADQPTGYLQELEVDDARLRLAKENLERIDVLGLTEQYDLFLDQVAEQLGETIFPGLRENAAPEGHHRDVPESLRRRIEADTAHDRELYEHARQLVELRRAR
jgi:AraC-like DNA-binding protein